MIKDLKNLPLLLLILDGWGIAKPSNGNAISLAATPTIDNLLKKYPSTTLHAHGRYVGLPNKQVGNSEAGHMNIGAGRIVEQDNVVISKSIKNGRFVKNPAFLGAIRHIKKKKSKIHLMGMLSNGQSPHSDPGHLVALLELLRKHKIKNVYLHLFTDGRDSPKYASLQLIDEFSKKYLQHEKIVTIIGRYYAMDRKKKWLRTRMSYNALVLGKGRKAKTAQEAITKAYNRGHSDEFIEPYIIGDDKQNSRIANGDSVVFFNLRSDRSRQLAKVFVQNSFAKMNTKSFKRQKKLKHLYFVAMTDFGPDLNDIITAFPSIDLQNTLPTQLKDLRQLYIAETEKYAHVTYFFNGGYSGQVAGEKQIIIPSPDVKSYDQTPAMSSKELINTVIQALSSDKKKKYLYDVTVLNLAAPDMIGHTGNLSAGIICCHQIDKYVNQIIEAYLAIDGTVLLTADHGNIETMINPKTEEIFTEHTANPVPFILINKKLNKRKLRKNGVLGDIAPTILQLLGIKKPKEMTGKSLLLG